MGTHISRVKSVDLDAWTDEQTQSMVKWGNSKANKYWEAKLESSHVPSESKIDNFVKTKYVSRRWVGEEERPDPDDLSDEENNVPAPATKTNVPKPQSVPTRTNVSTSQASTNAPNTAKAVPQQPVDSLLGLDFAGPSPAQSQTTNIQGSQSSNVQPSREQMSQSNISLLSSPQETVSKPAAAPRNDLKMSIMSLYASAPKPQPSYTQPQTQFQNSMQSNASFPAASTNQNRTNSASAFDDLNGLFGGMNVAAAAQPQRHQFSSQNPNSSMGNKQNYAGASAQSTNPRVSNSAVLPKTSTSATTSDPWQTEDDAWGGFQSTQSTQAQPKAPSAFDDLYSTSVCCLILATRSRYANDYRMSGSSYFTSKQL